MTVRAHRDEAPPRPAADPVERHLRPEPQAVQGQGVPLQQDVHAGPGGQLVQADQPPVVGHVLVGEPVAGVRPVAGRRPGDRQRTRAVVHPSLGEQPDDLGHQQPLAHQHRQGGGGQGQERPPQVRRQRVRRRLGEEHQVGQGEHLARDRPSLLAVGVQEVAARAASPRRRPASTRGSPRPGSRCSCPGPRRGSARARRRRPGRARPCRKDAGEPVLEPHPRRPAQLADGDVETPSRPGGPAPRRPARRGARLPERSAAVARRDGWRGGARSPPSPRANRKTRPVRADAPRAARRAPGPRRARRRRGRPPRGRSPPRQPMPASARTVLAGPSQPARNRQVVSSTRSAVLRVACAASSSGRGVDDLDAPLDLDPSLARARRRGPPRRPSAAAGSRCGKAVSLERHVAELGADPSPTDVQLGLRSPVAPLEQAVRHAQRPQALQGARVHDHRPGRTEPLRPALDDAHRRAVVVGLQGGGEPGGSGTHDEDVRPGVTPRRPRATTPPCSAGAYRSSTPGSASTWSRRSPGSTR